MAIGYIQNKSPRNVWAGTDINYSGIPSIWSVEITDIPAGKELYRVGAKVYLWDYDGVNTPITYSVLADMRKPPNRDNTAAFDISPVADSVMGVRTFDTFGRYRGMPKVMQVIKADYDMPAALLSLELYVITKDTTTGVLDTEVLTDAPWRYDYLFVKGAPDPHYNAQVRLGGDVVQTWWPTPVKWLTCAPKRLPKITVGSEFNFVILMNTSTYNYVFFEGVESGYIRGTPYPTSGNLKGLLHINGRAGGSGLIGIEDEITIISFGDYGPGSEVLRFQIMPRCPDKTMVTITWLNQWGGLDFYEFTAAYSETLEADIQTFTPAPDMMDKATQVEYKYLNGPIGTAGTTRRRITLNSDITTEDEGYLFEDMMRSPFIAYDFNRGDLPADTLSGIQSYASMAEPVSRSVSRARRYDQFGKFYYTFDFIIHAGAPTIGL